MPHHHHHRYIIIVIKTSWSWFIETFLSESELHRIYGCQIYDVKYAIPPVLFVHVRFTYSFWRLDWGNLNAPALETNSGAAKPGQLLIVSSIQGEVILYLMWHLNQHQYCCCHHTHHFCHYHHHNRPLSCIGQTILHYAVFSANTTSTRRQFFKDWFGWKVWYFFISTIVHTFAGMKIIQIMMMTKTLMKANGDDNTADDDINNKDSDEGWCVTYLWLVLFLSTWLILLS